MSATIPEHCCDLLDNVGDIVYSMDADGRFTWLNLAVERVLGYAPGDLLGRNFIHIVASHHTERVAARLHRRRAHSGVRDFFEFEAVARDGAFRCLEMDDRLLEKQGVLVGHRGVARDVTERRTLEAALRKSQALEAMGLLAGGIAHDFNNAMTILLGHSRKLTAALGPVSRHAAAIQAAGEHAAGLTRQLMTLARGRAADPQPVSLNALIEHLRPLLADLAGSRVALDIGLGSDLPPLLADPIQIEQIVLNLAANAADAMPRGGTLAIRTARSAAPRRPGAVLTVRDTGDGIPGEVAGRIFEPFVSTRKDRPGGIGLFVVREAVRQNRAEITVTSETGAGTEFSILFPETTAAGFGTGAF